MNQQEFIAKVTRLLDDDARRLEPSTVDALRAGRRRALAARRHAEGRGHHGRVAVLDWFHDHGKAMWGLLIFAILIAMAGYQMFDAQDAADVDIQLLTGDLPPQAYVHGDMGSWLGSREQ